VSLGRSNDPHGMVRFGLAWLAALRAVYVKLGITRRRELVAALSAAEPSARRRPLR
jgi:hypothetical protein